MSLSEPQRNLLGEIADGTARCIRQWSPWWRTASSLRAKGLVSAKWVRQNYYEFNVTDEGRDLVGRLNGDPDGTD